MRSEVASVVTHTSGYGNAIVDGREKNQWLKSIIDRYYQGFSEHVAGSSHVVSIKSKLTETIMITITANAIMDNDTLMSRYSIRQDGAIIAMEKRPTNDINSDAVSQFGPITARSLGEVIALTQAMEALTDMPVGERPNAIDIRVSTTLAWKIFTKPVESIAIRATHARYCHKQVASVVQTLIQQGYSITVTRVKGSMVLETTTL